MLLKFRLRFGTASKHLSQFLALSSIQQHRPFVRQSVTEQILVNLIESIFTIISQIHKLFRFVNSENNIVLTPPTYPANAGVFSNDHCFYTTLI